MTHATDIAKILLLSLEKTYSQEFSISFLSQRLEEPKDATHGDLAFPCFHLAKELKKSPVQIASDLEKYISENKAPSPIEKVKALGGFLNFSIRCSVLAQIIPEILEGRITAPQKSKGEKVMIEYSQPNTHKAFHVGHMRNVALGDSLVRLYEFNGYEVIAANYIGDVGSHIAKCLWVYQNHREDKSDPSHHKGEYLGELYSKADELLDLKRMSTLPHIGLYTAKVKNIEKHPRQDKWLNLILETRDGDQKIVCGGKDFEVGDLVAHAPVNSRFAGRLVDRKDMDGSTSEGFILSEKELGLGSDKNRIHTFTDTKQVGVELCELGRVEGVLEEGTSVSQAYSTRHSEVAGILKKLESGETETHELWKKTRDWSLHDFQEIYKWIDCRFDHIFYESDVGDEGKRIVLEGLEKGLFVKSEGAIGLEFKDKGMGFLLLLKSDDTGLYSTKDLALAKKKFEEFQIDRSIYVVDHSQSLHFKQVFKTLEVLGYPQAEKCFHLAYGMVVLPDGKMSSRKGNVVTFSKLQNTLSEYITHEFLEKYRGDWSDEEISTACRRIAVAAIRYGMLNQDNLKNIVFDLKSWASVTGDTGPYLLYAYARTRAIARDLGKSDSEKYDFDLLKHDCEKAILLRLNRFSATVESCVEQNKPMLLCKELYLLARDFSRFYENCPVKKAENEELLATRLALVECVGLVMKKGLTLLGIAVLERM